MAINAQKVLAGGVVAGAVLTGLDFLVNGVLLAEQNRAAMEAIDPSLLENMEGTAGMIGVIVIDVLLGILIVWTYAAMRPRFGAGPKTAIIAAVQIWLVAALMYSFLTLAGLLSWGYFMVGLVTALVMFGVAALVGGMLYREEQAASSAAS